MKRSIVLLGSNANGEFELGSATNCVEELDFIACPLSKGSFTTTMTTLPDGRSIMETFAIYGHDFQKEVWELVKK